MEDRLEGTVAYLQFFYCTLYAAKQNEEPQDRAPKKAARGSLFRPTYILKLDKLPKMTNSTSIDATFGGAWCNRMISSRAVILLLQQIND